ncbi:hypothetical protein HX882_00585 [Pseudomonas gingeri]|uniref:Uncharacterized protein n=1 Tax=Pseudomonas gingeri TaxID=117681 RepID=A0A7Y8C0B8_9PSED|nr:hypothetical protein [Pseudomonas gingeri]NWB94384.1 hypothetical protein [Pseudomonas gingeri]
MLYIETVFLFRHPAWHCKKPLTQLLSGEGMVTKEELQHFIRGEVHRDFFVELEALIPQSFQKADEECRELLRYTPPEELRGQMRHSLVQEVLAGMRRWSPIVRPTKPKGHNYVLLKIGNLRVTSVVLPWQKDIRSAKYRSELKALNESLAPTQVDWIDDLTQTVNEQRIHALVVVHAPAPQADNQSEPRAIILAVPYFNGKGFHMSCTLGDLVEGYADDGSVDQRPVVLVKLRDKMCDAEEADDVDNDEHESER